jgi:hypothetical protein
MAGWLHFPCAGNLPLWVGILGNLTWLSFACGPSPICGGGPQSFYPWVKKSLSKLQSRICCQVSACLLIADFNILFLDFFGMSWQHFTIFTYTLRTFSMWFECSCWSSRWETSHCLRSLVGGLNAIGFHSNPSPRLYAMMWVRGYKYSKVCFSCLFFVVPGFEYRALCLLGRCSTSRAMPQPFLLWLFWRSGLTFCPGHPGSWSAYLMLPAVGR